MKREIKSGIVGILIFIAGLFGYQQIEPSLGLATDASFNRVDNLTSFTTTTASYCATCPVKLLSLDSSRRYAVISNVSDTAVYLYATTTDLTVDGQGGTTATSSITSLNGIYLGANSNYEFNTENMVYSNIWASSTAASKKINVNYK